MGVCVCVNESEEFVCMCHIIHLKMSVRSITTPLEGWESRTRGDGQPNPLEACGAEFRIPKQQQRPVGSGREGEPLPP